MIFYLSLRALPQIEKDCNEKWITMSLNLKNSQWKLVDNMQMKKNVVIMFVLMLKSLQNSAEPEEGKKTSTYFQHWHEYGIQL